ncbi:hypothetical protein LCGC14_1305500 [marine sediment metagenome]|uniref:Uncharacterized protein n=1 Tax=marine sediment metagenome TaxID=412755 RepID=A0A0F9N545_9ZZZZ
MPKLYGPDKAERYWDKDYTEVEFLACVLECGTQAQYAEAHPLSDYWVRVDVWFERHFPERAKNHSPCVDFREGGIYTGTMAFKIAMYHWMGECNGTAKEKTL